MVQYIYEIYLGKTKYISEIKLSEQITCQLVCCKEFMAATAILSGQAVGAGYAQYPITTVTLTMLEEEEIAEQKKSDPENIDNNA